MDGSGRHIGRVPPRVPLNDLSRRSQALGGELEDSLLRVVRRGWYLHGAEVAAFEEEFAAYCGSGRCVGVASGTDALQLALMSTGCEAGAEILTAANAGGYTTVAALAAGLLPRYADISPETLCLTAETVEAALTDRTRAVVVTHLYGQLAEMQAIAKVCRDRSLALVEDCAQAAGARRTHRGAGTFGDVAAFSFYPTKNLGALGDAGAVLTDAPHIEARVRRLAQYGWEDKYRVTETGGRNSRLDELQAAALRTALPRLDGWNIRRREIVERYRDALGDGPNRMVSRAGPDYVAHLAVALLHDRDAVAAQLREAGVSTDVHYPTPDYRQPAWSSTHPDVSLPVTEEATARVLTLPCFPELDDEEVEGVARVLREL